MRVFITGASSGIGAGLARHYRQPGTTLGLLARLMAISAIGVANVSLPLSLPGSGVHARSICPGHVRTPMTSELRSPPFVSQLDDAVRLMTRAMAAKRARYVLPWQMNVVEHVLRGAPARVVLELVPASRSRGTL